LKSSQVCNEEVKSRNSSIESLNCDETIEGETDIDEIETKQKKYSMSPKEGLF
jgi:hypothetical protein